jgi:hypothetical protein
MTLLPGVERWILATLATARQTHILQEIRRSVDPDTPG